MKFLKCTNYDDLLRIEPRKLEGLIRDYIVYMREGKRLAHATMASRAAAISHFLQMNDIQINWKKIKKYMIEVTTIFLIFFIQEIRDI